MQKSRGLWQKKVMAELFYYTLSYANKSEAAPRQQRFQKVPFLLSTLTYLAGVFKFIHFGEGFQKAPFSDTENVVLVWTEGLSG